MPVAAALPAILRMLGWIVGGLLASEVVNQVGGGLRERSTLKAQTEAQKAMMEKQLEASKLTREEAQKSSDRLMKALLAEKEAGREDELLKTALGLQFQREGMNQDMLSQMLQILMTGAASASKPIVPVMGGQTRQRPFSMALDGLGL